MKGEPRGAINQKPHSDKKIVIGKALLEKILRRGEMRQGPRNPAKIKQPKQTRATLLGFEGERWGA